MKIKQIILILLLTSGFDTVAQDKSQSNTPVMLENQSHYDFAATVDSLSKTAVRNGWKVTIIHDLQETMKKNGKEVLPVNWW